jgi:hypothetical protein
MSAGFDDTVATTASSSAPGTKKPRAKKGTAAKAGRKKAKKEESSELLDQSSQMEEESQPLKARRGKKRSSDAVEESIMSSTDGPMSKKRAAQAPGDDTIESVAVHEDDSEVTDVSKISYKKNGALPRSKPGRKAAPKLNSHASMASLRAPGFPDDDEIERQLEADLDRHFTDDEEIAYDSDSVRNKAKSKRDSEGEATRIAKPKSPEYAMFDPVEPEPNETEIEDEFKALQAEMEVDDPERSEQVPKRGRKAGVQKASKQAKTKKAEERLQEQETEPEFPESQQEEEEVTPADVSASSTGSIVKRPILPPPAAKRGRGRPRTSLTSQDESIVETDESAQQPVKRGRGRPSRLSLASLLSADPAGTQTAEPAAKRGRGRPSNASLASLDSTGVDEDIKAAPAPAAKRRGRPSKASSTSQNPRDFEAAGRSKEAYAPAKRGRGRPAKKMVETRPIEQTETEAEDDFVEAREPSEERPQPTRKSPVRAIFSPKGKAPSLTPATPSKLLSPVLSARQPVLSPSQSPQSSDAENQPPSSRAPTASAAKRIVLAPVVSTPARGSPSKRNVMAGLRSTTPWASASMDAIFDSPLGSPGKENDVDRFLKRGKELTSPERQMSVEEWIYFNAAEAEKKLKYECESLVNRFEMEGTRAIKVLEGLEVEAAS